MNENAAARAGFLCGHNCEGCAVKTTWIVLGINLSLFLLKAVFALDTHSRSLLADALESMADVAITILVLFSLRIAAKPKDDTHPYGYGKVEFLVSTIINFILLLNLL